MDEDHFLEVVADAIRIHQYSNPSEGLNVIAGALHSRLALKTHTDHAPLFEVIPC